MNLIKYIILAVCILFTSTQTIYAQESAYAADHLRSFKDGKTLFNLGTYGAAQDQLTTFLQLTDNFSTPEYDQMRMEAEFLIAQSALRLGQSNAEQLLLSFVRNYKPDPYAHKAIREIASYYYNNKQYDKALTYYKEIDLYAISKEERTEIRFMMGYSELVQKNFQAAKPHFNLIKNEEGVYYYPANYYLAMAEYFTKNYNAALSGFKTVENSRRYRAVTPYYISHIYFLQDKTDELIPFAEASLEQDELQYRGEIKYLLGQAYFKTGEYKKALPMLESQALHSNRSEDIYQLAYSYFYNGDYDKAARHFRQIAIEEGVIGQNANFYLATSYIHLDNKADARVAFANAYRNDYDNKIAEEALFNYGKISAEMRYDREAVNALQNIPASSSFYGESQKIISDVFYGTKDYAHAIGIMEEMETLSPELKKAYQHITLNYGLTKLNADDRVEAMNYFAKSQLYPINSEDELQARYWTAYIHHTESRYKESIAELNKYFTLARSENVYIPANSDEAMARYLQGYNYFKTSNYTLAGGQFERAVTLLKDRRADQGSNTLKRIYSDALIRQGDCAFKENKYSQALNLYDTALNAGYSTPSYALYQKAIISGLQKMDAQKILFLTQISDKYPFAPYADDALLELGKTYQALGQFDQATPPLVKLVNNYKGKSDLVNEALLALGLISYNQGDVKEALKYYKQVVANNPDKETVDEALLAIKEIYVQDIGNPGEYVSYLESARGTKLQTGTKDSLTFSSANLAFESGNYEKAISNFTEYIREYPNGIYKTTAHYFRAESFAVQQSYKNALNDYEYVVTQGPGEYYLPSVEKAAKIAYNSTQDFAKALKYYEILEANARSEDKKFEALLGAIEAAYRSGNHEAVVRKAAQISISPYAADNDVAKAQYYLGKATMAQGNYDKALNAFNQVTQYSEDERAAEARYSIAQIYYQRQEYNLAGELAEKAYKESASYPYWVAKSLLLLSDVLLIQDNVYSAKAALEAIVENYKDDAEIMKEAQKKLNEIKTIENKQKNKSNDGLLEMDEK